MALVYGWFGHLEVEALHPTVDPHSSSEQNTAPDEKRVTSRGERAMQKTCDAPVTSVRTRSLAFKSFIIEVSFSGCFV